MNFLKNIYDQKLTENDTAVRFWEDYLKNLKALDFSFFSKKLTVPVLVPMGNKVFFRGYLKHTNEITVSLGADYFAKCTAHQAEILRQHRIKDAEKKLETLKKEREYLESQINFGRENVFENSGHKIVEVHTEEEDKAWRKAHKENVRKSKQRKDEYPKNEISDEELWNRLDELELREELENELRNKDDETSKEIVLAKNDNNVHCEKEILSNRKEYSHESHFVENNKGESVELTSESKQNLRLDLLQEVLNKQNKLENKLTELKNRNRSCMKTEDDLISRLDEIEQLEEFEDEMERLDNILHEDEEIETQEEEEFETHKEIKRSVTFADEDESETLKLVFKHSEILPNTEPYYPEIGITKPSDIYAAYSHLFTETTPILRRSKYESSKSEPKMSQNHSMDSEIKSSNIHTTNKTIIVKDISEKSVIKEPVINSNETRPISIFKKRRQQKN